MTVYDSFEMEEGAPRRLQSSPCNITMAAKLLLFGFSIAPVNG